MKYQNLAAFEKHLQEAFPAHLSHIYIVVSSCEFERRKIAQGILALLQKKDPSSQISKYSADSVSAGRVTGELKTQPLFGGNTLILFEGIEQLKKEGIEMLLSYLNSPSSFAYLILTCATAKNASELYQKGKKECVFLDMHEEKPWDKERRLKDWLIKEIMKEKKRISPEAIASLFAHVGNDSATLEQELSKLLCYSAEKSDISVSDVDAICSKYTETSSWQIVENLVWEDKLLKENLLPETSALFPMIGQVRYHLQIGQEIAASLQKGTPYQEIGRALPSVRAASLEKYVRTARHRRRDFFEKSLELLFEMELQAKNSALEPQLLWDHFTAKLSLLKNATALS